MLTEKLNKCRICLVENVRMYVVADKNLQEIYEKLTDVPFVTEDNRPTLACVCCCSKLKQCYQFQRKCLEAEELFAQMLNNDYETKPLINQDLLEIFSGFNITPTMHMSIVDECQTESIAIKEELPAICEGLDDIIEPKEEHESDELEPVNFDNSCLDVADIQHSESDLEDDVPLMEFKIEVEEEEVSTSKQITRETIKLEPEHLDKSCLDVADISPHHSESDLEDDVPLMKFETEVEDQEVFTKKRRAGETTSASVAKKPKLQRTKQEDATTAEVTEKSHTGEKPYECDVCQRSFSQNSHLSQHIRKHTGEKPYECDVCQRGFSQKGDLTRHMRIHTGEKPYKCDVCQRSFCQKGDLTRHMRIHTGEKPYKCDVCQRSFCQKGDLTRHMRIHTENPYKCDICQCSFRLNGMLTNNTCIHQCS